MYEPNVERILESLSPWRLRRALSEAPQVTAADDVSRRQREGAEATRTTGT